MKFPRSTSPGDKTTMMLSWLYLQIDFSAATGPAWLKIFPASRLHKLQKIRLMDQYGIRTN
jgi:hypothetical protein